MMLTRRHRGGVYETRANHFCTFKNTPAETLCMNNIIISLSFVAPMIAREGTQVLLDTPS